MRIPRLRKANRVAGDQGWRAGSAGYSNPSYFIVTVVIRVSFYKTEQMGVLLFLLCCLCLCRAILPFRGSAEMPLDSESCALHPTQYVTIQGI